MSIKAFEIVPAVERVKLMSDKAKTQIDCIEVCGKNLYIGTNDCFVVHYIIEEKTVAAGRISFTSEKQGHKYLAVKKPVVQLTSASALNRILVLCDNCISMLNMFDLEPIISGAKIKGVTSFCVNDNPSRGNPFSVEICAAMKKKQIQFFSVTEDRLLHLRDVTLPENPVTMSLDGSYMCVALMSLYCMINIETSHVQDLFPYDTETTKAFICKIGKGEFLLNGPSALGVFVTTDGVSQRPPLQWNSNVISVSYVHPYILALNDEFITVHSFLDQQQKQTIPFQGGNFLGDFDGKIFVSSAKEIYSVVPVAWEKQVQSLLAEKRVSEALELAKNSRRVGISKDKFYKIYRHIEQEAAFIELAEGEFDKAKDLFISSEVDLREVLALYPGLLSTNENFTSSLSHTITDINTLCNGDLRQITEYKYFLQSYLEEIRGTQHSHGYKKELDSALLKLYAEINSPNLIPLIAVDCGCSLADCVKTLEEYGRFHALSLLFKSHADYDKAMEIWVKLADGTLTDESFPGFEFVVEFLSNLSDHQIVWKYVDWALTRDEGIGIKIFTERPAEEFTSEYFRPDLIIDHLHRYPRAVVVFLEYLVFHKKLEKEKYHTHLAVLYLDSVLKLRKDPEANPEQIDFARSKLQRLLQNSSLYRVQLILGKVRETDLHSECAILYGKLEDHDKALRILVHTLKDYRAAENYCVINSQGKDTTHRKRLFHILLSVYLDASQKDFLVSPAITLLNSDLSDFDTIKVLQQLPENWSVGLLTQFVTRSLRTSLNLSRIKHLERTLIRGENLQTKQILINLQRGAITMAEERKCDICNRSFADPTFKRYPNGVICHTNCSQNKRRLSTLVTSSDSKFTSRTIHRS